MTETVSYVPVVAMLVILSIFVTIITNFLRYRLWPTPRARRMAAAQKMWKIYLITLLVGPAFALILRANIFDILKNPDNPAIFFGLPFWVRDPAESAMSHWFGLAITGTLLAFLSKLWNDVFDLIYEVKRWLRLRNDEKDKLTRELFEDKGKH